jgi:hypothetical protein
MGWIYIEEGRYELRDSAMAGLVYFRNPQKIRALHFGKLTANSPVAQIFQEGHA